MSAFIDLKNKKFGRLTVKNRSEDHISPNGDKNIVWSCDCDCGTKNYLVWGKNLRSGRTTSCGCIERERKKKYNIYDMNNEIGIGYTSNTNKPFYFDKEDYELIKNCCWYENPDGYIVTHYPTRDKKILFHRMVLNDYIDSKDQIDHIDHDRKNNTKRNLRISTPQQNAINKGMMTNNTSGYTGVFWYEPYKKWISRIGINGKTIHLGYYTNIKDALAARKRAEDKYFGEWSYFNSTGKETYE